MIRYCPYCGKIELVRIGISFYGIILRCVSCKRRFMDTIKDLGYGCETMQNQIRLIVLPFLLKKMMHNLEDFE